MKIVDTFGSCSVYLRYTFAPAAKMYRRCFVSMPGKNTYVSGISLGLYRFLSGMFLGVEIKKAILRG
ncbi:MAG TPA: hypothetical protein H9796_15095 [Candidatus Butyricimonas faecavium]|nr:hypothetical protein [Candidatus Butyricimonas faecavium]